LNSYTKRDGNIETYQKTQIRRGTGQIREKVKEDENGIGSADARSFNSESGEGAG